MIDNENIIDNYNNHTIMWTNISNSETLNSEFQGIVRYIIDVCYGKMYEKLVDRVEHVGFFDTYMRKRFSPEAKRKKIKKILLSQQFASPIYHKHLFIGRELMVYEAFKAEYPYVENLFSRIKFLGHKRLSKSLQTIESEAILGMVCKQIMKKHPKMPIATIHDCLVTTIGNEEILKLEVPRIIGEYVGLSPAVSTKYWLEAPNKAA